MKIAILNGSPRKQNTAAMVEAFAEGAKSAGHQVEVYHVGKMKIAGCLGCEYCHGKGEGKCIQKDDLEKLMPAYLESDMIVFASPIYYFTMTAQLEAAFIIDRRGYLAGAAVYSSEAGVWLDFLTLLINRKLRGEDLKDMIFSFPTSTYALVTTLIPLLVPTGMEFQAVKFYEKGFATQGFAFGGEEGADKFDNSVRYRSCLTNYVIDTGDEVILVDTGVPKESPATIPDKDTVIYTGRPITDYVTALGKLGYTPDRVTKILVTHKHEDHTGELRSFPNAKIYISPEDADALGLTGENVVRVRYKDGPYYNFPASEKIAEGICMAHPGQQRRHRRGRGALLSLPRGPELHRRGHVRRQAVGGL